MPLVSVIIPTIHRPELVRRAIASVTVQSLRDLEIIVVIDGRDRATVDVLDKLDEPRLRVVQNPSSLGPGRARNAGAEIASGEWLAFLDDDDEWLPNKLERQLVGRTAADAVLVTCRCRVENVDGVHIWPRRLYDSRQSVDEYLFGRKSPMRGDVYFATPTFLLPAWLFAKTRFGETCQDEDTTLLLRVTKKCGGRIEMLPDALVVVHEKSNESSESQATWKKCLAWPDDVADMISRRSYSGYCLVILGSRAARSWDLRAIPVLLDRAFRMGSPSTLQLILFASFWLVPPYLRRRLRLGMYWLRRTVKPVTSNALC
ncbi:MAG TPA: glycosyltransferase [Rhizomicrobium sp.]|jgi:glycosyltransferase involved in cell wall biosynthesis|nr:glycosyltransferase [Rhizomicrobium sp.]